MRLGPAAILVAHARGNVGKRVEPTRQPSVLLLLPLAESLDVFHELHKPGGLRLLDFRRTAAPHADPIHQAVPSQRGLPGFSEFVRAGQAALALLGPPVDHFLLLLLSRLVYHQNGGCDGGCVPIRCPAWRC
jgi:hypothetical protein